MNNVEVLRAREAMGGMRVVLVGVVAGAVRPVCGYSGVALKRFTALREVDAAATKFIRGTERCTGRSTRWWWRVCTASLPEVSPALVRLRGWAMSLSTAGYGAAAGFTHVPPQNWARRSRSGLATTASGSVCVPIL